MNEISNLKKIEWVHWVLDEISQGTTMDNSEIEQARDFIEDIRELFIPDMKQGRFMNYYAVKDGNIWTVEKNGQKVTLPMSEGDSIVAEFSSREEADRYIRYVGMLLEQGYQ